jgi:hypothetical protein
MRSPLLCSLRVVCAGLAFAAVGRGQAINIDLGNSLLPASTFGAASGQVGVWTSNGSVDIHGAPAAVTVTGDYFAFHSNHPATIGDDEALMDDSWSSWNGSSFSATIHGLLPGAYRFVTYSWASDSPYLTLVSVVGSVDPAQVCGGAWPGGYVIGNTHVIHRVVVPFGGNVKILLDSFSGFPSFNGIQIVPDDVGSVLCEPGTPGAIACPCQNPPSGPGRGCDNSAGTGGARLTAGGEADFASDTLVLAAGHEMPNATSIFSQGNAIVPGVVFGMGVRCVGGGLKRLYTKTAVSGTVVAPASFDPPVWERSAELGDPIAPGETRYYYVYYRDPMVLGNCPAGLAFNVTNALAITWN